MGPIVIRLATEFDGRALVGTVDATTQGSLANAYAVTAVPNFVFFKNGREVGRTVGAATYAELAAQLQALVAAP
jgi:thioredoxin 1